MTISRRKLIVTLGLGSAASLLPRAAFAAYPDRPIHLIVPFAPGGNADIVGRIVGERISSAVGQPVVVDNRGGAGGSIGAELVARAAPDGYTLFVGSNGPLTVNPFVQAKLAYDPLKDFAPIALTSYVPHCLILSTKVEAKTLKDLIAASEKQPVSIATSGVGTVQHLGFEMFKGEIGAFVVHVPYRGAAQIVPDVISGQVPIGVVSVTAGLAQAKAGALHALALMSPVKLTGAEDIPSLSEVLPGFNVAPRIFLLAPAGTPDAVIGKLNTEFVKILRSAEIKEKWKAFDFEPLPSTPQEFNRFWQADSKRWAEAVKISGFKATE